MIKSLFRLSLRMVTGFVQSLIKLCGLNWTAPDYSNVLDAKKQLNAYFEFYNLKRPHSSLDKMAPDEFYYDQLPQQNKVA